ncbi:MAG: phosphatase domain-containing putative toxin [Verrucomicrobiia bacterium]|jgi:atypical dual specificity phosphatase
MGSSILWWLIPNELAGMPMPYVHPDRRRNQGGGLTDFDDDLPRLHANGIRAVVSLVNNPNDGLAFHDAGFDFLCVSIPDFHPPGPDQANQVVRFIKKMKSESKPVVVHCHAGYGRTGTLLAAYLISTGKTAKQAIDDVRSARPGAIETQGQVQFLNDWETMQQ